MYLIISILSLVSVASQARHFLLV